MGQRGRMYLNLGEQTLKTMGSEVEINGVVLSTATAVRHGVTGAPPSSSYRRLSSFHIRKTTSHILFSSIRSKIFKQTNGKSQSRNNLTTPRSPPLYRLKKKKKKRKIIAIVFYSLEEFHINVPKPLTLSSIAPATTIQLQTNRVRIR